MTTRRGFLTGAVGFGVALAGLTRPPARRKPPKPPPTTTTTLPPATTTPPTTATATVGGDGLYHDSYSLY